MKRLFLASNIEFSAKSVAKRINQPGASLLFVTTAAETDAGDRAWLKRHRTALVNAGFKVTDYTLTGKTSSEIERAVAEHAILYMSGGNTMYLLQQVQQTKCAALLKRLVGQGKIYIGTSAGSQLAAPNVYAAYTKATAKLAPKLQGYEGLGLVDFIVFPHWGSKDFEKLYFDFRLKHAYELGSDKIILLTDHQFVQVEDAMYKIVDSKS